MILKKEIYYYSWTQATVDDATGEHDIIFIKVPRIQATVDYTTGNSRLHDRRTCEYIMTVDYTTGEHDIKLIKNRF